MITANTLQFQCLFRVYGHVCGARFGQFSEYVRHVERWHKCR